ncbi:MAG: hypothetical protein SF123_07390 [Chloroflexota bacterium]|nr:hypothetical protein [Chloroflexota bacterium]
MLSVIHIVMNDAIESRLLMIDDNMMIRHQRYGAFAADLFRRELGKARLKALLAKLWRKSCLLPLPNVAITDISQSRLCIRQRQAVRLDNIVGTVGSLMFDAAFHPMRRDDKQRWMSVAIAMLTDPTSLPPIQAVEVNGRY